MQSWARKGISVFEIVIGVSIMTLIALSVIAAFHFYLRAGLSVTPHVQAILLAEEGLEVVRYLRDESWATYIEPLSAGTQYYPVYATSTNTWELASTSPGLLLSTFERDVTVEDVYRRTADDTIVDVSSSDPKELDDGTKHIRVEVRWIEPSRGERVIDTEMYLTNLRNN